MRNRLFQRAVSYYLTYGFRRFGFAVLRKLVQRARHYAAAHGFLDEPRLDVLGRRFPAIAGVDEPTRPPSQVFRKPFVAVIGDLELPQCKKYRVLQKLEAFEALGIASEFNNWRDGHRSVDLIQMATFVIFYRTRMDDIFGFYLEECARLKVPNAYDIDDPIFSEEIYRANANLDYLEKWEREGLIASTSGHLDALLACDSAIVSTPKLVEEVKKLGKEQVFLWRNAVDRETAHATSQAQAIVSEKHESAVNDETVTIVYSSGSRAHEADFRTIEDDIAYILKENDRTRLKIIGYLNIPDALQCFGQRIESEPFSGYDAYVQSLAKADISLIPLVTDDFNHCKSAIRWMEAALLGLPSVVSSVGDFKHLIADGRNGFLATSSTDWREHISALIADSSLRRSMAEEARKSVQRELTVEAIARDLPKELKGLIDAA